MEEFGIFITICATIVLLVFCGVMVSKSYNKAELHSVGIERIAHCSNAYSNWNEIVWIKKDYVK